jgi:hypothetical protein
MFKLRWSTFSVLCVAALVATLAFLAGQRLQRMRNGMTTGGSGDGTAATTSLAAQTGVGVKGAAVRPQESARSSDSIETTVRRLLAQPPTPARNEALLAALGKLARQNPLAAIALARSEKNPNLSRQMLDAAFTGWGATDATHAADWILAQPEGSLDSNAAISSVLRGAVQQDPETAVQLAQHLNQVNPSQAREYGDALIYALGQYGGFQRAADFAATGSDENRSEWLAAAFGNWSNYQPEDAAAFALGLGDAGTRAAAIDAVIPNWAQINPKNLADFAMNNLSDGDQKTRALNNALVYWAGNNVADAAQWIGQQNPSPELDQGEAAIATQQDVMKQPDVALSWAQGITDTDLRSKTIMSIVQTWALTDRSAALNYIQSSQDLRPDDRDSLMASLNSPSQ